jgi:hypothetical protein
MVSQSLVKGFFKLLETGIYNSLLIQTSGQYKELPNGMITEIGFSDHSRMYLFD